MIKMANCSSNLRKYADLSEFISPYINRFLQPDTIIPDLSNPQSWNRYSYVTNRPVVLSDPTGHDPIIAFLMLVAVAFVLSACDSSPAYEGLTPRQAEIQKLIDKEDYQGAIDKAVELYDIDTHGVQPNYGEYLVDPARTTPFGGEFINGVWVGGGLSVLIGPNAFTTPDELVDSIAHEAVHAEQFKDGRWYEGDAGKALREVEAYDRIASLEDELEITSDEVIKNDRFGRDLYYHLLPSSIRKRVDDGIYVLP